MKLMVAIAVVVCCAGCGASGPKPAPGRAALTVLVRAEPKAGWRDADSQTSSYDIGDVGRGRAFETLNYSALEGIVVWVQPSDPAGAAPRSQRLTIDVGRPSTTMHACGLRDSWSIQNSAPESLPIYAVYESGRVIDLGMLPPGGQMAQTPREPGLVQIMCDIRPDPLAQVYVAPVPTAADGRVRVTQSGARIAFRDLPPGPARVSCWHLRLPGSGASVTLVPGATATVTVVVGVNLLPTAP